MIRGKKIFSGMLIGMFFLVGIFFVSQRVVLVGSQVFVVEWAETNEARKRGLGGHAELCARCGMLFVFDRADRYGFWMQDMTFSLDILWIADHHVVFVKKNFAPTDPSIVVPPVPADLVVEVPAGTVEKLGIHVGDRVWGVY